jgi:hypothetical protein
VIYCQKLPSLPKEVINPRNHSSGSVLDMLSKKESKSLTKLWKRTRVLDTKNQVPSLALLECESLKA